jgi:TatD DNase family protein
MSPRLPLTDAHGHLQAERFDGDREEVIARLIAAGATRLLVPSWSTESSRGALEIVRANPWMDAAIGIHPHHATDEAHERAALLEGADAPEIVAIGETGIDTKRNFAPIADQVANLEAHIEVAVHLGKPLILHCRSAGDADDAQRQLIKTLKESPIGAPGGAATFGGRAPFILHSASGSQGYIEDGLALGGLISLSGLVFRPEERATADWIRSIPLDRLLTETDAPWLAMPGAPDPNRNEPANVALTLAWIAERRDESIELLAKAISANYDRAFPRSRPRTEGSPRSA